MPTVHTSPFSGTWYPDRVSDLESLLDERFAQSRARTGPFLFHDALAFIVPHAGPVYSGAVAAAVYRALRQQQPEQIVVLAFPHRGGLRSVATPDVDAIATPFGAVTIDRDFVPFPRVAESRVCDHSFEIQLPFLQSAVPGARVTPVYVGRLDAAARRDTAGALAKAWRPGVVFLASSDFTHYGQQFGYVPWPLDNTVGARLEALDSECVAAASSLDADLFLEQLGETGATVCGMDPIALLLETLWQIDGPAIYQSTLDYQTSGEVTGDFAHSVSYAALGYFRREAFDLEPRDCEALVGSVTETLWKLRESGWRDPVRAQGGSPALESRRSAFVSLHRGQQLLGCAGNCHSRAPLAEEVPKLALSAALVDPRFRPPADVLGRIDIEISVLTPLRRVRGPEHLSVGRHGALMRLGARAGLLLPQVAAGRSWTTEEFLEALARKCLFGPHAWRDPEALLSIFEAQVFGGAVNY